MNGYNRCVAMVSAGMFSLALVSLPARADDAASERSNGITVVASGLGGPYELSERHGRVFAMESTRGQVTEVNKTTGELTPLIIDSGRFGVAFGAAPVGDKFAIVTAESDTGSLPSSSVLTVKPGGPVKRLADLLAYELEHNPDGQTQFGPDGTPLGSLSNPYYVLADRQHRGSVLVADEGGNDVLRVNRKGRVSSFFVPPTVNTGACRNLPNNDVRHPGCDAMPTGLAYGPRNTLYVSAGTAQVAGEGRVYVLNAKTGRLKRVIGGLNGPTGVAVDPRTGTVYVSELFEGHWPSGEGPPPGFDPETIGQIVKISPHGQRQYAQVTMPSGLLFTGGKLYASAWATAADYYMNGSLGQVVTVATSAFVPAPS